MKSTKTNLNRVIIVKLEPEEDLIDSLKQIVKEYKVKSGLVNCIGALKQYTIGYFDIDKKQYNMKTFNEYVELVSCIGNISHKDGEPIIHVHAILGKKDYSLIGGHLGQPSVISITGEVYIYESNIKLLRKNDIRFDLSLLQI